MEQDLIDLQQSLKNNYKNLIPANIDRLIALEQLRLLEFIASKLEYK